MENFNKAVKCKACGKPIMFQPYFNDDIKRKCLPVNPQAVYYEEDTNGDARILTSTGRIVRGFVFLQGSCVGYIPHYMTCDKHLLNDCKKKEQAEKTTKCKVCGEDISFIKTKGNKLMPVNVEPVFYKKNETGGKDSVLTVGGEVVRCDIVKKGWHADGSGFVPHFATCKGYKKAGATAPGQISLFGG